VLLRFRPTAAATGPIGLSLTAAARPALGVRMRTRTGDQRCTLDCASPRFAGSDPLHHDIPVDVLVNSRNVLQCWRQVLTGGHWLKGATELKNEMVLKRAHGSVQALDMVTLTVVGGRSTNGSVHGQAQGGVYGAAAFQLFRRHLFIQLC
jgi:hypothetical protein